MLIDSHSPDVWTCLDQQYAALPPGAQLLLLIDGAFVPGLFRTIPAHDPILLFASLPGCSAGVQDVSPMVVRFEPDSPSLARALSRCSGWPMVSAIVTRESADRLAHRLAAWCVVEVDGQRFNFRFPDTRRLPAIFGALTDMQRAEMTGNAASWRYVGRDGTWQDLPCRPVGTEAPVTAKAQLDNTQFAQLVSDSEPDEMWVLLQDRAVGSPLTPSRRHALLATALDVARDSGIDQPSKVRWCAACLGLEGVDAMGVRERFVRWTNDNVRRDDEKVSLAV